MISVRARTYDRLQLTWDEAGSTLAELQALPWHLAGVAAVRGTRLGVELDIGPYAGRLVLHDGLRVDVDELVPGTARTCLELSRSGRRQAEQHSPAAQQMAPQEAVAVRFVDACLDVLRAGPPKQYIARQEVTARPRGKILLSRTVRGPWARGRRDRIVVKPRLLSEDTALSRVLLAASLRAERLLDRLPDHAIGARTCLAALGGASLADPLGALDELDRQGPHASEAASLARTLILGVPLLPSSEQADHLFSAWLNLHRVFEEAVLRLLSDACPAGAVAAGRQQGVQLLRRHQGDPPSMSKRADPDVVVRAHGHVLVVDAKYRRSGEKPTEDELYQLIAHAGAFEATHAALVCPALTGPGATRRLGRDARGCPIDVVSVDPADAASMRQSITVWTNGVLR